jgi:hypothetical protein
MRSATLRCACVLAVSLVVVVAVEDDVYKDAAVRSTS